MDPAANPVIVKRDGSMNEGEDAMELLAAILTVLSGCYETTMWMNTGYAVGDLVGRFFYGPKNEGK